jgi:hypothetical protein
MTTPVDTASAFVILELTGQQRGLHLLGRALPSRETPPAYSGKMRAEFTHYPGNPVATVQVIGPEEGQTTCSGTWKDRFLGAVDSQGNTVQPDAQALLFSSGGGNQGYGLDLSSDSITSAAELAALVDDIRRSGQLLEVSWDWIKRRGIMTEFEFTPHNRHDYAWKMTFEWCSQAEADPPLAVPQTDVSDVQAALSSLGKSLADESTPPLALVADVTADLASKISQVETAISGIAQAISQAVDQMMAPLDSVRRILGIIQYTKATAQDVMDSTQARAYESMVVPMPVVMPGTSAGASRVTAGRACAAAKYQRDLRATARSIRGLSAQRGQEMSARIGDTQQASIVRAKLGQDLRSISIQVYGTPDQWRLLKTYNGLTSSSLDAGQVVLIPPLQRSSQVGT